MTEARSKAGNAAAEKAAFGRKVKLALEEAQAAAVAAYEAYAETAPRAECGLIAGPCGGSDVFVVKPSHRFRTALKDLKETGKPFDGRWDVSCFTREVDSQCVTAHDVACEAACEVLAKAFPEDGQFFVRTYVD